MELEVPCVLPPPSLTSEQMLWVNQVAVRGWILSEERGRKKYSWREFHQATGIPPVLRATLTQQYFSTKKK